MARNEEHGVLIRIQLSDSELGTTADDEFVDAIDNAIRAAVERAPRVGSWDGHEFGGGWAIVFCYGENATALSERVIEALLALDLERSVDVVVGTENVPMTLDSLIMFKVTHGDNQQ